MVLSFTDAEVKSLEVPSPEERQRDYWDPGMPGFGVRVGFGPDTGLWQLAFIGRNLTNEHYIQFGGDTPLAGSTFGANSDYAFADRGRTLAIQARVNF